MGNRVWLLVGFVFLVGQGQAATPPNGYLEMTGLQKRNWHEQQAQATADQPGVLKTLACNVMAAPALFLPSYLRKTMQGSGYADDIWRKLWGKAIHSRGVTAPGLFLLRAALLGLPPGEYPVTYRLSLANVYSPWLPGLRFRPGLLIMIHGGAGQPDRNIVLMPATGLEGVEGDNPLRFQYTPWLDQPGVFLKVAADLSFGVEFMPYTQFTNAGNNFPAIPGGPTRENSFQLLANFNPNLVSRYDQTNPKADFRTRMIQLGSTSPDQDFFTANLRQDNIIDFLGKGTLTGTWKSSWHGDHWFAGHIGFAEKVKSAP